jgi:hypothetical protein
MSNLNLLSKCLFLLNNIDRLSALEVSSGVSPAVMGNFYLNFCLVLEAYILNFLEDLAQLFLIFSYFSEINRQVHFKIAI